MNPFSKFAKMYFFTPTYFTAVLATATNVSNVRQLLRLFSYLDSDFIIDLGSSFYTYSILYRHANFKALQESFK